MVKSAACTIYLLLILPVFSNHMIFLMKMGIHVAKLLVST